MIKKIYLLIILLLVSSTNYAYSAEYTCSFDKLKPGVTAKNLEKINIFTYGAKSPEGFFSLTMNSDRLCEGELKDAAGLTVELMFFDDKLIKVNYINDTPRSLVLYEIAKNDYKVNFNRNQQQVQKKQSEFYKSKKNDTSYFYVLLKAKDKYGDSQREYLEIISDNDTATLDKFLSQLEEQR